ncbi:hypothetical protein [Silvimonas amylolytica]|uniref:SAF domain-containing protein n=1 Tax=Silvimonas amylolytica TaxID=449663 RepID=A0ABQ2PPV8_9NEIS|nr:hypothetical protein [Silvimonas amylolytica]GGP27353.1 hypothetical protein GCM10010971_31720 [Silvimonas amylolytica]
MDTSTQRQRAGGLMLDLLAAGALCMAIAQAMNIGRPAQAADETPAVPMAFISPTGLIMPQAKANVVCSPIEESESPLLRGYGRYLIAEHAIAAGDVLSLPSSCALKPNVAPAQASTVRLQLNDEHELVQPDGLRLI